MRSVVLGRRCLPGALWSLLLLVGAGLFGVPQSRAEPVAVYQLDSDPAIYIEVDLHREIYRYSADPRLRDVMVLDAEGKELPSRIHTLQPELTEVSWQFALSFFPVLAGEDPSNWLGRGTELRIADDTVSLRLEPPRAATETLQVAPEFYLIDISQLDSSLTELEVHWLAEETSRVVAVELSASNDLRQWRRLTEETLAQLSAQGESLLRNRVNLSLQPEQYDYLRLRFVAARPVHLQGLIGHHIVQRAEGPAPQRWRLSGAIADDQRAAHRSDSRDRITAWEFQRDDRAPVNRISIDLGDTSYGDRLRLYSRGATNQPWQLRHAGIWFNVKVGDLWQQSEALHLGANSDPLWRLELNAPAASAQPGLILEHPQQRLRFIANNNPPYYIAINERVPAQPTAEQVFTRVVEEGKVSWHSVNTRLLEGAQPLEPRSGWDWQAVLFWFSLSLAVAVLLFFALRLLRQMDRQH